MNLKNIFQKAAPDNYVRRYVRQSAAERAQAELQRDIALAGIHDGHPLWAAVLALLDEHAESEGKAALAPNLTSEQRHFTAGAAATAEYLAQLVRDARDLAVKRMAKEKS